MATTLVNATSFIAASGGTAAFVFASARPGLRTLAQAVSSGDLVDDATVAYHAQDVPNATMRAWGHGIFNAAANSITRDVNEKWIDASGGVGTTPFNFPTPPIVAR